METIEKLFVYSLNRAHTLTPLCPNCAFTAFSVCTLQTSHTRLVWLVCIQSPPLSEPETCDEFYHISLIYSQMPVSLSDCLGSKVFVIIKSDINGNIMVRSTSVCIFMLQPVEWWSFHTTVGHRNMTWCSSCMKTQPKCDFFRKLKTCILRILRSTSPCRTLWRQREKPTQQNGPKLEQHWLLCGWKGELSLSLFHHTVLLHFRLLSWSRQAHFCGLSWVSPAEVSVSFRSSCRVWQMEKGMRTTQT